MLSLAGLDCAPMSATHARSKRPDLISARKVRTACPPTIRQRMPERFRRCATSVLQAASTTPEPMAMPSSLTQLHVWMPPCVQEVCELPGRVIGCGHVSGLIDAALFMAAGRYGDARTGSKSSCRAHGPFNSPGFPDPICPIIVPCSSPTSSHARRTTA